MDVWTFKKRKDFDQEWIEQVGGNPPTMQEISAILDDSILIQRTTQLLDRQRRVRLIPAVYWNPRQQLVIQVDQLNKRLIRVFTPKLPKSKGK